MPGSMECSLTIAKHNFANHRVDGVVDRAAEIYERRGLKFTILRRLVLEVLAERHTPVGAYTIIRVLEGRYRKLSPISVYRALNSLISLGVVHKVRTQNAYVVAECIRTRTKQAGERKVYLICESCRRVTETNSPDAYNLIEQASGSALFKLSVSAVEVTGICDACAKARPGALAGAPSRPGPASNGVRRRKIAGR